MNTGYRLLQRAAWLCCLFSAGCAASSGQRQTQVTATRGGDTAAARSANTATPQATAPAAPTVGTPAPDPARFANDIRTFVQYDRKNTPPQNAVLFVGSSSIRMWDTATSFPEWTVINRGFGGSHATDALHYFDQVVAPYDAQVIVFYEGDNDIADGRTPEQVRDAFKKFVGRVRERKGDVPVVFLSIKPSASRWSVWPQTMQANELIRAFCGRVPNVHYVDLATPLLGADGHPNPDLYLSDALHLNATGYAVWTQALRPVVEPLRK